MPKKGENFRPPVQRVVALGPCTVHGKPTDGSEPVVCGVIHQSCKGHKQYSLDRNKPIPCGNLAVVGQLVCTRHGGRAGQNIAAAEKRMARERALGLVGPLLEECFDQVQAMPGPEQMLMGINHAGAMALTYRRLLEELPVESKWSWESMPGAQGATVRYVKVDDAGMHGPDQHGVGRLHAYEEGFRHWTRLHGQLLKAAADYGLDERRQRFAEEQVRSITTAVRGIVEGLGRDLDDPAVVPVVEAALRAITAQSSAS